MLAQQREDGASDDSDGGPLLEAPAREASTEHLFWPVARRVIPILWLGYVLNIVDRTNLAYAQLQMVSDLGLSARDFGQRPDPFASIVLSSIAEMTFGKSSSGPPTLPE